jgi:hypothetical protein
MRQTFQVHRSSGRVLIAAMVLLTLGIGLCLFDVDDHHAADGVSFDLCLGLAIVSIAVVVLTVVLVHPLVADPRYVLHAVPLHRLDPPPRSAALS